jgi:hypothetical protein
MLRLVWRHCGSLMLLLWAADNLLGRILPLRIVIMRRHTVPFLRSVPLDNPAGYEVRIATREELLRTVAANPLVSSAEFVEAALRKGDICVAVFDGSDIASFSWTAATPT